jgi:hypothetical protein
MLPLVTATLDLGLLGKALHTAPGKSLDPFSFKDHRALPWERSREKGDLPGRRFVKYSLGIAHRIRKLACHENARAYLSHKRRLLD